MLKKIKDLSKEEIEKICRNHNYCSICALSFPDSRTCLNDRGIKEKLEEEVEVDTNVKED